jgi:hypothetical protein
MGLLLKLPCALPVFCPGVSRLANRGLSLHGLVRVKCLSSKLNEKKKKLVDSVQPAKAGQMLCSSSTLSLRQRCVVITITIMIIIMIIIIIIIIIIKIIRIIIIVTRFQSEDHVCISTTLR